MMIFSCRCNRSECLSTHAFALALDLGMDSPFCFPPRRMAFPDVHLDLVELRFLGFVGSMAFIRRNWEAFILFAVGLLMLCSLEVVKEAPVVDYRYGLVGELLLFFDDYFHVVTPVVLPVSVVLVVLYCFLPVQSQLKRSLVDAYAIFMVVRILMLFLLLNLLLFAGSIDAELLIIQLFVFLPSLLLMWGWIYWRFDLYYFRSHGRRMFLFMSLGEALPTVYDYFLASFVSLLSNTLAGFSGRTRLSRTLIFIHGVMMWDVMGLIFSRAIALAVR